MHLLLNTDKDLLQRLHLHHDTFLTGHHRTNLAANLDEITLIGIGSRWQDYRTRSVTHRDNPLTIQHR